MNSLARFGATALVLVCANTAHAQDTAAAEILFAEGRTLMAEEKLAEACPKLAESQRLAPAVGTLLNLGICYEKSHLTASAWTAFKEAVSLARVSGQGEREHLASTHVQELEPQLSTLTVRVVPASRNVPGLEVRRDGLIVSAAAWGSAIPVDPGTHRIEVAAPSKKSWSMSVVVGSVSAKELVEVPALEDAQAPVVRGPVAPPSEQTPERASVTQRNAALVVVGIGVASAVVGTIFGLKAKSTNDEALTHCVGTVCDETGLSLTADARTAGNVSTVAFGVGAAALITGSILFFTAPKRASTASSRDGRPVARWQAAPTVSSHGAAFLLGGAW